MEDIYQAIAGRLGRLSPAQSEIYLAKLVLLLAREVADPEMVQRFAARAMEGLD